MKNLNLRGVKQILRIESTHVSITESEVLQGTFTFDSTMVEGSVFQIGTAVADEINVTVVDPSNNLETYIDETYSIYLAPSVEDRSQANWTLIGTYVIAELDNSFTGQSRVKFQDLFVTMDSYMDFTTGTLYANLQSLGLTLDLTQDEISFLSGLSVLNPQTMTKRDFIRGCALIMWENAYLKPDGKLAFRILNSTNMSFAPSDRFSSQLGEEVTLAVNVVDSSGAVIYSDGTGSQKIEITPAPITDLIGSIEGLATYYSTHTPPGEDIADFSYTPLTMSILSTWELEPGDEVAYIDKNSNSFVSVVTSVAHVLNGASACTSAAETKTKHSQQIPSQTDETRVIVQQLEKGIDYAQTTASEAMPKYGVCETAASTATKEVSVGDGFVLRNGARVAVYMRYSNTATGTLKLKVNSTEAKNIVNSEGEPIGFINGKNTSWLENTLMTFVYDGTNWRVEDNLALTRINNILTENIVGTNGWINLKNGTFNFGSGKLVWDIPSGGSTPSLSVSGTINSTYGNIGGWSIDGSMLRKDGNVTINNVSTPYRAYMQAPESAVEGNGLFALRFGASSPYDYPFLVQYDGTLTAKKANITGTISGSTITGSTITGGEINITAVTSTFEHHITSDTLRGTLNIGGTYDAGHGSNSASLTIDPANGDATLYGSNEVKMGTDNGAIQFSRTDGAFIGGSLSVSGNITSDGHLRVGDKRSWTDANSGVIATANGYISMRAMQNNSPGIFMTAYGSTTSTYDAGFYYNASADRLQATKQIYVSGQVSSSAGILTGLSTDNVRREVKAQNSQGSANLRIDTQGTGGTYHDTQSKWIAYITSDGTRGPVASTTENGFMSATDKTRLNSMNSVGAVNGGTMSVSSGTTNVDLLSSGITLAANHKYLFIYAVQWTSNANGRRHAAPYIDGTEIGVITTDNQTAVNGAVTFNRGVAGIAASSSARTLMIKGYQNSGSSTALTATVRYQLIDLGT